jgi:hypothetical protein
MLSNAIYGASSPVVVCPSSFTHCHSLPFHYFSARYSQYTEVPRPIPNHHHHVLYTLGFAFPGIGFWLALARRFAFAAAAACGIVRRWCQLRGRFARLCSILERIGGVVYTVRSGNLHRGILTIRLETRIRRIIYTVRSGNLHRGVILMSFLFRPGDISIRVAVEITVVCGIQFPI